ncbi:hypothetical protein GCM10009801_26180 [Streptomyces albiaxialis]|uniref:Uncharacterized protein n=1 Tax=Streptomyces albiaxialis TaxID=329523 RepID=A0ABP5HGY8_9ACTN
MLAAEHQVDGTVGVWQADLDLYFDLVEAAFEQSLGHNGDAVVPGNDLASGGWSPSGHFMSGHQALGERKTR